jgi:hypothetical protein
MEFQSAGRESATPPAVGKPEGTGVPTCVAAGLSERGLMVGEVHPENCITLTGQHWIFSFFLSKLESLGPTGARLIRFD